MPTQIESGLQGVPLSYGDHVCAFYHGPAQRDEIMLPFLRAGMVAGEPCIAIVDGVPPEEVRRAVDCTRAGAPFDVLTPYEAYLVDGRFDTDRMLEFWQARVSAALAPGVPGVRAVGEMTWSLRDAPGCDQLVSYEARLNEFLPLYPQVILCLYDLERFSGAAIIGMLSTHPLVLLNGTVRINPYYVPPDAFLAA